MADKAPQTKPAELKLKRNGRRFTATWTVKSSATSNDETRATHRQVRWYRYSRKYKKWVELKSERDYASVGDKADVCDIPEKYWNKTHCAAVKVQVYYVHQTSSGAKLKSQYVAEKQVKFAAPGKIYIGAPTMEDGAVSCVLSVKKVAGTKYARISGKGTMTRSGYINGAKIETKTYDINSVHLSNEDKDSYTYTFRDSAAQSLTSENDWIKYEFNATTNGPGGDSASTSRSYTHMLAQKPVITRIDVFASVVRVALENRSTGQKTANMQLQVGYSLSNSVSSWEDIGSEIHGAANYMECNRGLINPELGYRVFFRIAVRRGDEAFDNYSEPYECAELYNVPQRGQADPSVISIVDSETVTDTDSIKLTVAWDNNTNYNGTELAWSTDMEAWESTKAPTSMLMRDIEWSKDWTQTSDWDKAATIKVAELDENTTYYFRARRYNTDNESLITGWSEQASATTGALASGVLVNAPAYAAQGEPLTVSWVLGGERPQTDWAVSTSYTDEDGNVQVWNSEPGADETSVFTVPGDYVGYGSTVDVTVIASNGNGKQNERTETVALYARPSVTITAPSTITALPYAFSVAASESCSASVALVSMGATASTPTDDNEQYEGDVVWQDVVQLDGDNPNALQVPLSAGLINGCTYHLMVEPFTAFLAGDSVQSEDLLVAWAHEAKAPSSDSVIAIDAEAGSASITIAADDSALATDTYSVYRHAVNGLYLIASDLQDGDTVIDAVAPYHAVEPMEYVLAATTQDGDMDWDGFAFDHKRKDLLITFGGQSISLPYNIVVADAYAKDFESIKYLDGTTAGYWNDGAAHTATMETALTKFGSYEQQQAVAELARHAGTCFVRTPTGHAYEADVQLGSITWSHASGIVSCSFTATEVNNGEYLATRLETAAAQDAEG